MEPNALQLWKVRSVCLCEFTTGWEWLRLLSLLLSVLALIVLSVVAVIWSLTITCGSRLWISALGAPLLLLNTTIARGATIPSPKACLRRAIATLLLRWVWVGLPDLGTAPRGDVGSSTCDVVSAAWARPRPATRGSSCTLSQLCHQVRVLRIETTFDHGGRWSCHGRRVGVLVHSTITSHVPSTAANTTDNISSEIALFRAVVFAMSDTATVLANLVLIIAQSTVESRKFTELVTLVIILTFWSRCSLYRCLAKPTLASTAKHLPFQSLG